MKNAQQMANQWQAGMRNPQTVQKYKDGIQGTTVNPMALAASPEAQNRYLNAVNDSVASGRRAAKLNAVPVDYWKQQATNIGSANLSTGAQKGMSKVQAHFNRFAGVYQQARDAARAIPKDGSIASALARVQAAITVMKQGAGKPV